VTTFSEKFRSEMVSKMLGPSAVSANSLAQRAGVTQSTLSRWLRDAKMASVSRGKSKKTGTPKRRARQWTAAEKLRVVVEAGTLDETGVGELLRREGLHTADLEHFREEALAGLTAKPAKVGESPEAKRIKELERELRRKEKALAEAAALLVLRKKLNALWGEAEGEDTDETDE
jgi:transposase-like protein